MPHALGVEERGQQRTGRAAGRKDRQRVAAERANGAGDVDAPPPGS